MTGRDLGSILSELRTKVGAIERREVRAARGITGDIGITAASKAPKGALLARGQSLRRKDYPRLFAAIGTSYGSASNEFFNLPNAQGRALVGMSTASGIFDRLGASPGAQTVALGVGEMPSHNHGGSTGSSAISGTTYPNAGGTNNGPARGGGAGTANVSFTGSNHDHSISSQGGGTPHNNVQPSLVVNYYIWT